MQLSSFFFASLTATIVSAQAATSSTASRTTPAAVSTSGQANSITTSRTTSTGSSVRPSSTSRANGTNTTTGGPAKATTNNSPSLLSQSGGIVTVAGLSVMFAVFM
ncbi:unnamed protein product [Diplocarpon coronariae]